MVVWRESSSWFSVLPTCMVVWRRGPSRLRLLRIRLFKDAQVGHAGLNSKHVQLALGFFINLRAVQGARHLVHVKNELRLERRLPPLLAIRGVLILRVVQDVLERAIGIVGLVGGGSVVVLDVLEQLAQGLGIQPQRRQLARQAVDALLELRVGDGRLDPVRRVALGLQGGLEELAELHGGSVSSGTGRGLRQGRTAGAGGGACEKGKFSHVALLRDLIGLEPLPGWCAQRDVAAAVLLAGA